MTLSTNVAIRLPAGKVPHPKDMLDVAVKAVLDAAGETREDIQTQHDNDSYNTVCGQGLPAWTFVHYRNDGPYTERDLTNRDKYPEDYEDDDDYGDRLATPACVYLLDFDTAYSYSDAEGNSCTTLHAKTIVLLNEWVCERGGSLMWENEYAGSWHEFTDEDGWRQFIGSGSDARRWFNGTVRPALTRQGFHI